MTIEEGLVKREIFDVFRKIANERPQMENPNGHLPVLLKEAVEMLTIKQGGTYIDGTIGSGGHALEILKAAGAGGFLFGIDCDEDALMRAHSRLSEVESRLRLVHGNFADMESICRQNGIKDVGGVLLDIGVSSEQLEKSERGFSFLKDGPLDMRMDQSGGERAEDLINDMSECELAHLLRDFGEEPMAARIAREIITERAKARITRTIELAELIERVAGGRRGKIHPATRTFQALRIAVNNELDSLRKGLSAGVNMLAPGGRMAVISFHSLEDRIIKHFFVEHAGRWESLQAGGRKWNCEKPAVVIVNRKVITASREEEGRNPRSRSAKLRVVERVEG